MAEHNLRHRLPGGLVTRVAVLLRTAGFAVLAVLAVTAVFALGSVPALRLGRLRDTVVLQIINVPVTVDPLHAAKHGHAPIVTVLRVAGVCVG